MSLLEIDDLRCSYGPTRVLHGVSFAIEPGDTQAILGRNGAGKTTLIKAIVGLVGIDSGEIRLDGVGGINSLPAHKRASLGIGHVPQGRQLFPRLTVAENMQMGAMLAEDRSQDATEAVFEAFPKLVERRDQKAGTLSGGEQQMVAIGRAIATVPRVLLLDEPSEGLAPAIVDAMVEAVVGLSSSLGFAIVLVEQNLAVAFDATETAIVLERGKIVREGKSDTLRNDSNLIQVLAM